ncbi:MAG: SCO family protein [Aquificae bacterium]|nr:SCO family protein [Aquificota bacterium]
MKAVGVLLFLFSLIGFGGVVGPSDDVFKDTDRFNPEILKVDERKFLGNFVANARILLEDGRETELYSLLKGKPTILLLSYYTCEGTCPVRVINLNRLIQESDVLKNRDFRVLVLSFDEKDTLQFLKSFKEKYSPFAPQFVFGLIKKEDIEKLTQSVGFKFFFSERDKTFVHPNVYIFVSPDGKITRYLYGVKPEERDVRIALAETEKNRISFNSIVDLAYLACFTYDPSRSRYVINPTLLFGGIGFLALGAVVAFAILSNRLARKEV